MQLGRWLFHPQIPLMLLYVTAKLSNPLTELSPVTHAEGERPTQPGPHASAIG